MGLMLDHCSPYQYMGNCVTPPYYAQQLVNTNTHTDTHAHTYIYLNIPPNRMAKGYSLSPTRRLSNSARVNDACHTRGCILPHFFGLLSATCIYTVGQSGYNGKGILGVEPLA